MSDEAQEITSEASENGAATATEVEEREVVTEEEVRACFKDLEVTWASYRDLQRVAVSSDHNRRVFEGSTEAIDDSKGLKAQTKKGACLYILGRVNQARELLARAHPESEIASVILGRVHEDAESYEEARDVYDTAAKKHPKGREALLGLIKVSLILNDFEGAEKLMKKAGKDDDAELEYLRGFGKELVGEYEAARDHYEAVLDKDENHANALFRLGRYHMTWGDEDEAVDYYERCCTQVPTYGNALINLGLLYEDRNKYDEALRCYQGVLKAIPGHPRASMFLKDAEASKSMYYDEERERRQDRVNQVLNIPVSDFELSVRSRNCLNKMDIKTLGDLMKMNEPELLAHKNFGETSLLEVKQMLAQKGLRLGQTRSQVSGFIARGPDTAAPQEDVLKQPVTNLELSVRSRNCMNRLGIKVIGDLTSRTEQELLSAKNFGETSLNEIKSRLAELGLSLRRPGAR